VLTNTIRIWAVINARLKIKKLEVRVIVIKQPSQVSHERFEPFELFKVSLSFEEQPVRSSEYTFICRYSQLGGRENRKLAIGVRRAIRQLLASAVSICANRRKNFECPATAATAAAAVDDSRRARKSGKRD
jgi:hypothetical protein